VDVDVFLLAGYDIGMAENSPHRMRDPWERRPDEEPHQYQAFEIYANLPPGERSLKQAYRLYIDNPDAAGPSDNFKGWAKRHNWKVRATAWDDAKAHARYEGQIRGVEDQWEKIAAARERANDKVIDLVERAYDKACEIYEQELTKDNYSMAHAVQMTKVVFEGFKILQEQEKIYKEAGEGRWTEEDEREMARILDEIDSEQTQELFEERKRRLEAELEELRTIEFFEEQRRKQKENEEDEEDEGTEDPQAWNPPSKRA